MHFQESLQSMFNTIARICGISFFCIIFLYWYIGSISAQKEKPKAIQKSFWIHLKKTSNWVSLVFVCVQLAGVSVLPIPASYAFAFQVIGFMVMSIGCGICIWARYLLGANWVGGYEYQIKNEQILVTTGIYAYIRHPIYIGVFLLFIGGEMIAQSLLWISVLFMSIPLFLQAKREEVLLGKYFGNTYREYQKRTHMFIPFVW